MGQITACNLELGNCRASIASPFSCKKILLSSRAKEWLLCKYLSGQAELLGFRSLVFTIVYKMVEFAKMFNNLQLYSCMCVYMLVCLYICLYIYIFNLFFFFFHKYQACDTDPELNFHPKWNKYISTDFSWAKEGYKRWFLYWYPGN